MNLECYMTFYLYFLFILESSYSQGFSHGYNYKLSSSFDYSILCECKLVL